MRHNTFIACALLLPLCLCEPSSAQPQNNPAAAAAANPARMTIRSYDVSDLLRPSRDYPYDSAVVPPTELSSEVEFTGLGGEQPRASEQQDLLDATALIDLILAMVDPGSWDGWRPAPKRVIVPAAARRGGGGGGGGGGADLFGGQQNPQQAQPDVAAAAADKARL